MTPLLMIAASLLPEIAQTLASEKNRDAATALATAVSTAVTEVAGTADAAAAQAKLAADPAIAADLRIRLAQIAADQEERRRKADLAALRTEAEDRANARAAFSALASTGNWAAFGAPAISLVVTLGFLLLVVLVVLHPNMPALKDGPLLQLLHVMFGTLATGFATVISYWLGSSVGSRNKDAVLALQGAQASVAPVPGPSSLPQAPLPLVPPPAVRAAPASNFQTCLALVLQQEGGFVDHPQDPGGATNLGITKHTLEQWRGETVTSEDVRQLTQDEAGEIYRARYWNALRCDALPAGVDLVAFDMSVNLGPARAARLLQKSVGAAQDGAVGPATLAAVRAAHVSDVVRSLTAARLAWYQSLPTWPTFGRGWTRRSSDIERAALAMAG